MKILLMLMLMSSQLSFAAAVSAAKEPETGQQLTKQQRAHYEKRLAQLHKAQSCPYYCSAPANAGKKTNKVWGRILTEAQEKEYENIQRNIIFYSELLQAKKLTKEQATFVSEEEKFDKEMDELLKDL